MESFLLEHQKGIGGSDVAAIMGISPWKTPLAVYLEKTMPLPPEGFDGEKPQLARGKRCEKYILEEYAERTGQILAPGRLVGAACRLCRIGCRGSHCHDAGRSVEPSNRDAAAHLDPGADRRSDAGYVAPGDGPHACLAGRLGT